jgi:hypothetical protein
MSSANRVAQFQRGSIDSLTTRSGQIVQQFLGSGEPEVLTAAGLCSLLETTTLIDASAAGASFTIGIRDAVSSQTHSYNQVGLIKIFAMTTVPAPGVQVTIAPQTPAGAQQAILTDINQVAYYIWDGQGWSVVSSTGGGGGPGSNAVLLGRSLFVSSTTGNDATALPDHVELAYQTIQAAITAATAGDTVFVYPGDYAGFSMKPSVDVCGVDAEHSNGTGFTGSTRIHKVLVTGAITIDNATIGSVASCSNMRVEALVNASALVYGATNRLLVTFSDVAFAEFAAGDNSEAVIDIGRGICFLDNCSVQTTAGSLTYAVHMQSATSFVAFNSAIIGNWLADDDRCQCQLNFCYMSIGSIPPLASDFRPRLRAYTTAFTPLSGAAKPAVSFRGRVEMEQCLLTVVAEIASNSDGDSFDAESCIFREGIYNAFVTADPLTFAITLRNCDVETNFDFSTPSGVSVEATNCFIQSSGANLELAPEVTGLGASYRFKNCAIEVGQNFQMLLQQTVVPVGPSAVHVELLNCSCVGGFGLGAGSSFFNFNGPADTTHADNFIFLNNSFYGPDFGVGGAANVHITSGGNQGKVAPGYDAQVTVSVAYSAF